MNITKTDSMRARTALIGAMLLAALAMGLCLAQPAWADEDSSDETYNVTVTGVYHQADAYSMLAMINKFRTAEVDENDGNTPWAWNETDTKKVHYDGLKELKWSSDLEKIAMQRAAEIALLYDHQRPNGKSWSTSQSTNGESPNNECLTLRNDLSADEVFDIEVDCFTASKAFESWREDSRFYSSPGYGQGHRRAMLGNCQSVGIACFEHNGVRYWSMEFGDGVNGKPSCEDRTSTVEVEVDPGIIDFTLESFNETLKEGATQSLPTSVIGKINKFVTDPKEKAVFTTLLSGGWEIKSGSDILSLKGNEVTALKPGSAILSTTALGKEVTCTIVVANKTTPSITNFDETKTVKLSDNLVFFPKCDSDANPNFKSSNESVATVDGNGKVTLKKMGYADITVSYAETDDYEAVSKTCKLTVVDDATNVPADGKGEVQIYIPGQNNANVTVTPAAKVSAPAKTSITKLKKAKKAFTVKWKKKSGVTGYQIRYSLKSSMKGSTTVKVKSAKTVSKKVKKLKKKKKYYVQVRTYKVVNGKTYWSGWSAKKSVKTK